MRCKDGHNCSKCNKNGLKIVHMSHTDTKAAGLRGASRLTEDEVKVGLASGHLFEAKIRFNANNLEEAFCSVEGFPNDIFINGRVHQNRAIHGDVVVLGILRYDRWYKMGVKRHGQSYVHKNSKQGESRKSTEDNSMMGHLSDLISMLKVESPKEMVQDTLGQYLSIEEAVATYERLKEDGFRICGEVVCIKMLSPLREHVVGYLKNIGTRNGALWLNPFDRRIPSCVFVNRKRLMDLVKKTFPEADRKESIINYIYKGRITHWNYGNRNPEVELSLVVGHVKHPETGINAILQSAGIFHTDEFDKKILESLSKVSWPISRAESADRKDLTSLRIFSIDPESARDLDDALSIEKLDEDRLRIGVHIADVSYFVK